MTRALTRLALNTTRRQSSSMQRGQARAREPIRHYESDCDEQPTLQAPCPCGCGDRHIASGSSLRVGFALVPAIASEAARPGDAWYITGAMIVIDGGVAAGTGQPNFSNFLQRRNQGS